MEVCALRVTSSSYLLTLVVMQETFKVLLLGSSNSTPNAAPRWRETDYTQYDVIAADHVFTDVNNAVINDHTSSFAVRQRGVWLAFRDQVRFIDK